MAGSDCSAHQCWRTAPGGYCLEPRCYCGACPWYAPIERQPTHTPDTITKLDSAAVQRHGYSAANRAQARWGTS